MPERMAEIEQGAIAAFVLVAGDDFGLDLARPLDRVGQRGRVAREQAHRIPFEPVEKFGIDDEPVLDHFGEAGSQLPIGQRGERVRVCEDGRRLVERTDEILSTGMVHSGLAAHGRIDLREQRRGDLHERDAALITGGREPCHVADDAASQGNDAGVAREAIRHEHVEHARHVRERLVDLAVRQHDFDAASRRERRRELRGVDWAYGRVGDDENIARGHDAIDFLAKLHGAGADEDRIAALAQADVNSFHA
jgi:hypothetical protein